MTIFTLPDKNITVKIKLVLVNILLFASGLCSYGQILIPSATPVTQNFDGMGSSGTATLPTGFKIGNNLNTNKDYTLATNTVATTLGYGSSGAGAVTGTSSGGAINWANGVTASSTDRALGFLTTNGYASPRIIMLAIKNTSALYITDLDIAFDYEKYRAGTRQFNWTFSHSATSTSITTSATGGTQSFLPDAANGVVNPPTTVSKSLTLSGLNIAPGGLYYLCWACTGVLGSTNGQGIGIDNLSLTATLGSQPAVPVVSGASPTGTVGTAFTYNISATNGPISSYAVASGTLPSGLTLNTATGLISGTPTTNGSYSVTVTATNGTGTSLPATLNFTIGIAPYTCYTTDFESENASTKSAYAGQEVTLENGVPWYLEQCLIGTTANDWKYGLVSLRMNGDPAALFEMDQDQADGMAAIQFKYINYNYTVVTSATTTYVVEYSKDGGNSWILAATFVPSGILQTFNYTLNQSGPVRIHIKYYSGATGIKFNLDDLVLCNYNNTNEIEVAGNNTTITNGSTTTLATNNTNFGNTYFVGDVPLIKTFTVTNQGTGTLTLSTLTIAGDPGFTISTGLSATSLAAGATANFNISFTGASSGLKTAVVTIGNDDANESPYTFTVSAYSNSYTKCTLQAKTTIGQQDFEASPASPVLLFTETVNNGTAVITKAGGTNYGADRTTPSNMFIGAQSYLVNGAAAVSTNTLTFSAVDVSAYKNINLSFNLGAYAIASTQGLETKDMVTVSVSEDNGATWHKQIVIGGNNDAIWDINAATGGTKSRNYDSGTYVIYDAASSSANTFSNLFTISNLPNSAQLMVKFEFKFGTLANTNEIFSLDNVILDGQLPQAVTWNGAWAPGAPTSTTKAIISANYNTVVNGNITACDCQITAGNTLSIGSGNYIEIQGNIRNSGILNVANNGSLVQIDDMAVNAGNIVYNRDVSIKKFDYVYWSAPVAGFPVTSVSSTTAGGHIWKWLPQQSGNFGGWINANENMSNGKGYIVRGPTAFDNVTAQTFSAAFAGFANTGVITTPIERGAYTGADYINPASNMTVTHFDDNWNLIGNPYPSAIKALDFLTYNTNIEGAVRLWTHGSLPSTSAVNPFYDSFVYNYSSNDYIVYNGTGTISGPAGFSGYIAGGQGFFVLMNDGAADSSQSVVFNNSMRNKVYSNSQFYRNNSTALNINHGFEKNRIWLDLVNSNGNINRTLVGYVDGATYAKDRMFDARARLDGNQNFYSLLNGEPLNIQGRSTPFDNADRVPLGFQATASGSYTIAIAAIDGLFDTKAQAIYLEDAAMNIIHDLRHSPYIFTSEAGKYDERFILRYSGAALDKEISEDLSSGVVIFSNKNQIKIRSKNENIQHVTVYDLLGRSVFDANDINDKTFTIDKMASAGQALIVKVNLQNGQIVSSKIIF